MKNKETVKRGSKEVKEQEVQQQKHMTGERNSRIVEVERHRSTKAEKQGKQRSRKTNKQKEKKKKSREAGKAKKQGKQKAEKQRIRKAEKQKCYVSREKKQRSSKAEAEKQKIRETGKHRTKGPKKIQNLPRKKKTYINSPPRFSGRVEKTREETKRSVEVEVEQSRGVVSCHCIVFCKSFLADRVGTATSWSDLNVRICTKIVLFRANRGSVAEKSWLACATVSGVVALPSNPARYARAI